ncbi:MAG TPA: MFS transporter [Stellaceae bacterium]|nr:MFS transporter [Stellaceae bacterium]
MNRLVVAAASRVHYAWVVLGVTFVALLATAALRSTPSVLIVPLEHSFGWSAATISLAISVNLFLYGFLGPFGAALMQRFGIRRTAMGALSLVVAAVLASSFINAPWQLVLTWGVMVGTCCGLVAPVFGATIVNRWFTQRRGLAMGIVSASSATGQLLFLPPLAAVAANVGWRPVIWIMAAAMAAVIPLVAFLLPDDPAQVGLAPYGDSGEKRPPAHGATNPLVLAFSALGRAVKSGNFWLLFASFFVCGASANGLVGTHLIPFCSDHGIPQVTAAGLLAAIGAFTILGTTLSGWLSDRIDNRVLLMFFYTFRGLSLLYLPYSDFSFGTLSIFALFYGLDYFATVPPTVRLITDTFGKIDTPVVYGWVFAGHQVGAASIALIAGVMRSELGSYFVPFILSGLMCLGAAVVVLRIGRTPRGAGTPSLEPVA